MNQRVGFCKGQESDLKMGRQKEGKGEGSKKEVSYIFWSFLQTHTHIYSLINALTVYHKHADKNFLINKVDELLPARLLPDLSDPISDPIPGPRPV